MGIALWLLFSVNYEIQLPLYCSFKQVLTLSLI
jgi:hypothetical protein